MHYRQTILDTAVAALEAVLSLASVTGRDFYAEPAFPAARVWCSAEDLPDDQRSMTSSQDHRVMALNIQIVNKGDDVIRSMNDVLADVEGVMGTALDDVADCSWMQGVQFSDVGVEQDSETLSAELTFEVYYSTVLGDPATRA